MSLILILNILVSVTFAEEVAILPNTCNDLLPDVGQYINLLEQTGDLCTTENTKQATIVYDVLAIRNMYLDTTKNYINPIDGLIKNFLCDCSSKNKDELFASNSKTIRTCLEKDGKDLIKKVKNEYINLKLKINEEDKSIKFSSEQKAKVERLREQSLKNMTDELNSAVNKKIKLSRKAS